VVTSASVAGSGKLTLTSATASSITGAVSGGIELAKAGASTLTLSGSNTYTGGTTVNAGTLSLSSASAMPSGGNLTIRGGATVNAAWTSSASAELGNLTLGGAGTTGGTLSGSGLAHGNLGHFKLSGNLSVLGTSTSTISADLRIGSNFDSRFDVASTGDASGNDLLISGKLGHHNGTAWGYMTKAGAGSLRITGTLELGGITVSAGKLALEGVNGVGMLGWVGGPVALTNNAAVEIKVAGSSTASLLYSIAGIGTLTKLGTGTAVLTASNSYSGATAVSEGTLALSYASGLGSTAAGVSVASGATLDLRGVAVSAETVTLQGGTFGTSTGSSSLTGPPPAWSQP
jgi:autotransporter-associated beta strand protein